MPTKDSMTKRVCAVVVTYNRKDLLVNCCRALIRQLMPGDCLLIVDNASTDGTGDLVQREFVSATYLRLEKNAGGAGGFSAGMQWAYDAGYEFLWLMDDDGVPADDCLDRLLEAARERVVAVPLQRDTNDRLYGISIWDRRNVEVTPQIVSGELPSLGKYLFTFVGPLIPRCIIKEIGFPQENFFIWFDDHEFSMRLLESDELRVRAVTTAEFRHDMGEKTRVVKFLGRTSTRSDVAPWKIYYGIRNPLFTLLYKRKKLGEVLLFAAVHMRLLLMDAYYGPQRRQRVYMRVRGATDGVFARMGRRH